MAQRRWTTTPSPRGSARTTPHRRGGVGARAGWALDVAAVLLLARVTNALYLPAEPTPLPEATTVKCTPSALPTATPTALQSTDSPSEDATALPWISTWAPTDATEVPTSEPAVLEKGGSVAAPEIAASVTERTPPEVADSLKELVMQASSRNGRYASEFSQPNRGLFSLPRRAVPPVPLPGRNRATQEPIAEVSKDVFIHLAPDEPLTTANTPPPLPPRKHYKIIVIKPPTPAPHVQTTTRAVDVETLIYVLVPKAELPAATPSSTTPRAPSKHEVFFIRYKAPPATTPSPLPEPQSLQISGDPLANSTSPESAGHQSLLDDDYNSLIDIRSKASSSQPRIDSDEDDENELDGTVGDSDAYNDLLSVSSDDIVRSWRRSDGDIGFEADLRRAARSHNSIDAEPTTSPSAPGEQADLRRTARSHNSIDAEPTTSPSAPGEQAAAGAHAVRVRCTEHAPPDVLNAALRDEAAVGKHVEGGPDFDAVRQRRAHYGHSSVEICTEQAGGQPFALRREDRGVPVGEDAVWSESYLDSDDSGEDDGGTSLDVVRHDSADRVAAKARPVDIDATESPDSHETPELEGEVADSTSSKSKFSARYISSWSP